MSMTEQTLRNYEAKCDTVNRLLDEIIVCNDLDQVKAIAHNAKDILQYGF